MFERFFMFLFLFLVNYTTKNKVLLVLNEILASQTIIKVYYETISALFALPNCEQNGGKRENFLLI
jgi:hypothetical protein